VIADRDLRICDQRCCRGHDTHNRHQRAWTLRYCDGRFAAHRPRPATVLDTLAVFCKQGITAVEHGEATRLVIPPRHRVR